MCGKTELYTVGQQQRYAMTTSGHPTNTRDVSKPRVINTLNPALRCPSTYPCRYKSKISISRLIRYIMLPVRMRMRLSLMLMLVSIIVIMLVLLCMSRVLEVHRMVRMLGQVGRVLDVLFLELFLVNRLLLQGFVDHLLMHFLVFVDYVQERLLGFGVLVIMHSRAVGLPGLSVRACNMRLLARTMLATLRRTLVGIEQDGGGLPTFLLADLLAR